MENITMEQIESTLKMIAGIITSLTVIFGIFSMWYKKKIANKFNEVDDKLKVVNDEIVCIKKRLDFVESKRDEYEGVAENSKFERKILMSGLLSALKGLEAVVPNEYVSNSIKEIEEYMMEKTHD